jgi:adenylate cyclase
LDPRERLTRDVTLLLAQLRGFERGSESFPASALIAMLSRALNWMCDLVHHHAGTIVRASADTLVVAFEAASAQQSSRRAAECAIDMQIAMAEINAIQRGGDMPEIYFGIGINSGQLLSPRLAGDPNSGYALIGLDVDLASRIQALALRGQVLLGEGAFEHCRHFVQAGPPIAAFVRGQARLAQLRELLAIPSLGKAVPRRDNRRSPRVEVSLPLRYRMVVNRVVVPEDREGRVLDLGYQGMLARIGLPVSERSDVELRFALPEGRENIVARGKVIKVMAHEGHFHAGIELLDLTPEQQAEVQLYVQKLVVPA